MLVDLMWLFLGVFAWFLGLVRVILFSFSCLSFSVDGWFQMVLGWRYDHFSRHGCGLQWVEWLFFRMVMSPSYF